MKGIVPTVRSIEMLQLKGARERVRPISTFSEVVWKDMMESGVIKNMTQISLNKYE